MVGSWVEGSWVEGLRVVGLWTAAGATPSSGLRSPTGGPGQATGWVRRAFGQRTLDEMVQGPGGPGWLVMAGA